MAEIPRGFAAVGQAGAVLGRGILDLTNAVGAIEAEKRQVREQNRAMELVSNARLLFSNHLDELKRTGAGSEVFKSSASAFLKRSTNEALSEARKSGGRVHNFVSSQLVPFRAQQAAGINTRSTELFLDEERAKTVQLLPRLRADALKAGTPEAAQAAREILEDHIVSKAGKLFSREKAASMVVEQFKALRKERAQLLATARPNVFLDILENTPDDFRIANLTAPERDTLRAFAENRAATLVNRRLAADKEVRRKRAEVVEKSMTRIISGIATGADGTEAIQLLSPSLKSAQLKLLLDINRKATDRRLAGPRTNSGVYKRLRVEVMLGQQLDGSPFTIRDIVAAADGLSSADFTALLNSHQARLDKAKSENKSQRSTDTNFGLKLIRLSLNMASIDTKHSQLQDNLLLQALTTFKTTIDGDPHKNIIEVARAAGFNAALTLYDQIEFDHSAVLASTGFVTEEGKPDRRAVATALADKRITKLQARLLGQLFDYVELRERLRGVNAAGRVPTSDEVKDAGKGVGWIQSLKNKTKDFFGFGSSKDKK